MSLEFELPMVSLIFIIIISIVYFSKKNIDLIENKSYKIILICSLIETTIDLIIHIICALNEFDIIQSSYYDLLNVLNKILSMLFIIIFSSLFYYIALITYKNDNKNIKKILIPIIIINAISAVILLFTNIKLVDAQSVTNVTGATILYGYFVVAILLLASLIISIININKLDRRYISIFSILGIMGVLYALTLKCPGIIIYDLILALLCYIMYFTIENPDLKMVNELLRNKELVEKQMEDKSRFLFEVTEDIKTPTKNILAVSDKFDELYEKDKKDAIKIIRSNANSVLFKINDVLDISSMDASKIKIFNNEYNVYTLFETVEGIAKNLNTNKNVDLKFDINSDIPTMLYGDDVRLKQILISVLSNSISNTKTGFINLSLSSIVRYDVVRLIIKIEDSGCGMSIDKINTILDDNRELTKEEVQKLDKLDMDLVATIKSIKLLGGSFNIRSEEDKGSTFTIVIDQKCDIKNKTDIMRDIEKYSSDVFGKKRVLVVDDDKEELFKISDILSKYNVDINSTMSGKDCVYKIKAGEIYNLIIIDDELKSESALGTLEELMKIKKFNSKVIVMITSDKKHLKKHYIEDGFDDVILKDDLTEELRKKCELDL